MTYLRFLLLFGFMAACGLAQTNSAVVPPGYARKTGNQPFGVLGYQSIVLPSHEQVAYDGSLFPSHVLKLQSLAFRWAPWLLRTNPRVRPRATVTLSTIGRPPSRVSLSFAGNQGANRKVVFAGTLDWPASSWVTWTPFSLARIPLSSGYVFGPRKGTSLVLDMVAASSSGGTWLMDGIMGFHPRVPGKTWMEVNHSGFYCRDSRGQYVRSVLQYASQMVIGGAYEPVFYPVPPNAVAIASVGLVGVGGTWGGAKLPIALPGAPACNWAIAPLFTWAYLTDARGFGAVPPLVIPHDAKLVAKEFYDQPAFLDPKANQLGMVTSWSHKWTIGYAEPVAWLFRFNDSVPPAKMAQRRWRGWAPIMQITY